jgi:hypothetical protein
MGKVFEKVILEIGTKTSEKETFLMQVSLASVHDTEMYEAIGPQLRYSWISKKIFDYMATWLALQVI